VISIVPHMRILVAVAPIDFRAGIDGIARICRQELESDPFSGTLFECPLDCTLARGK
jgi:transposase